MQNEIKTEYSNEIKIKSIKFNFVMNIILKLSSIIFPLISLPYITRILGTAGNGKVAFATSIISYFSMFAQLGIPTYGIRVCAKCRDNKEKLTKTVQEILTINMISTVFSYIVFIILMLYVPKFHEEPILMIISSATILLNTIAIEWFYQAIEQYKYITIRNLVFKILTLVSLFLFVKHENDYIIYGSLAVISASGSSILNLIHSRKYLFRKKYTDYNFKQHLKPIFNFFLLSVSVSVYTNMDTAMIGFLSNDDEVGIYNIATKIKIVLATMVSALGPVLLPRISYYMEKKELKEVQKLIKKSMHFVLIASISVTVYFIIMATQTIDVLGGEKYYNAIPCMEIIMLTIIPLGLGNVACMQILAPFNREVKTMKSTFVGAIVNLIANFFLIRQFGALGAAIATVIAEYVVAIIQIYYAWDIMGNIVKEISYYKIIIANAFSTIVLIILKNSLQMNEILFLIVTSIIYYLVYISVLALTKDEMVRDFCLIVKNIIFKKNKK